MSACATMARALLSAALVAFALETGATPAFFSEQAVFVSGQDGYNTTIRNLRVERCTFVTGPDSKIGVAIDDNPWGEGRIAGVFEANVFIHDLSLIHI